MFCLIKGKKPEVRAYWNAWKKILTTSNEIQAERQKIQNLRQVADPDLFTLQQGYPPAFTMNGIPSMTSDLIIRHYHPLIARGETRSMPEHTSTVQNPKVLLVSHDVIDNLMGGPGLRYYDMAVALSRHFRVTLAVPKPTTIRQPDVNIVFYREDAPASLEVLVDNHDVALVSGYMSIKFPFLEHTTTKLIVDLYDPIFFENMYYYFDRTDSEQMRLNEQAVDVTNRMARIGDFFICGTEKQRDFWLGLLTACGRINPQTFRDDPTLRKLIDVVGLAFPDHTPEKRGVLRSQYPILPADARIVIWGGGIWNWLDPISLVKAWPQVVKK